MLAPFDEKDQLNHQLQRAKPGATDTRALVRTDSTRWATLPGQPRTSLAASSLHEQLRQEFVTPDLDTLAPHLWLVATQNSSHISPLHELLVKGRDIVVTENPELHLVWTDNRVFIKPIPPYMLNHAFWATHLLPRELSLASKSPDRQPQQALTRAALGYMRTYCYLIRHESDLRIARQAHLLPFESNGVNLENFHRFITGFGEIQDDEVSPRYSYGTLQLSRLNFWAKVFLHRFQFYQVHRQYGEYFARFYAPILFFFGILSVVLSAMQVGLQATGAGGSGRDTWAALQPVSFWFCVATLLCICAIGLAISLLLGFMFMRELAYAMKDLIRRRRDSARIWSARMTPI